MKKSCCVLVLMLTVACSEADDKGLEVEVSKGTPVPVVQMEGEEELQAQLAGLQTLTAAELQSAHAVPFTPELGYVPGDAANLSLIQDSALGLTPDELTRLDAHGFVMREAGYPSFTYGYAEIYSQDLPLYISADSIIHAVHRSYDSILKGIEKTGLIPELITLIDSMRQSLKDGGADAYSPEVRAELDLYLTVGKSLLEGELAAPEVGADASRVASLVDQANAGAGVKAMNLFGSERRLDFSQFKPRGHYTEDPKLENYFRTMMWFGRIDFRILEPNETTHALVFNRQSLELAYALQGLMNTADIASWSKIDETIGLFVGEPDNMTVPELDELLAALQIDSPARLDEKDDAAITQVLQKHGFGTQRISSHYMVNGWEGTMPLSTIFLFFGQRYVIDSHVFSNVVFDRAGGGDVKRMMPNPLDVAYAALGNDQAAALLAPELQEYAYAPDLEAMRVLTEAHGDAYWDKNLYNGWLKALRNLSPTTDISDTSSGLPAVARTEAWGRRILNTQLASWAELRHDTILYAKQSYTNGAACEFPDAYVDPYPEFYAALSDFAERGEVVVAPWSPEYVNHFQGLRAVTTRLEAMARAQRDGQEFTQEQLDWVNEAVTVEETCGSSTGSGWYPQLILEDATEFDPTIADVHTQPTDEFGNQVGRVLHVGTGLARMMVVTVDTCTGPRAYVGLASSYYERVTEDFQRLNDDEWSQDISGSPAWVNDL